MIVQTFYWKSQTIRRKSRKSPTKLLACYTLSFHQKCFVRPKMHLFSAEVLPWSELWTPLGELTTLPRPVVGWYGYSHYPPHSTPETSRSLRLDFQAPNIKDGSTPLLTRYFRTNAWKRNIPVPCQNWRHAAFSNSDADRFAIRKKTPASYLVVDFLWRASRRPLTFKLPLTDLWTCVTTRKKKEKKEINKKAAATTKSKKKNFFSLDTETCILVSCFTISLVMNYSIGVWMTIILRIRRAYNVG